MSRLEDEVAALIADMFRGWDLTTDEADAVNRAVRKIATLNGDVTTSGLSRAAFAIRAAMRLSQLPDWNPDLMSAPSDEIRG